MALHPSRQLYVRSDLARAARRAAQSLVGPRRVSSRAYDRIIAPVLIYQIGRHAASAFHLTDARCDVPDARIVGDWTPGLEELFLRVRLM